MYTLLPMIFACATDVVTLGADSAAQRTEPLTNDAAPATSEPAPTDTGDDVPSGAIDLTRWSGTRRFHYDATELGYYCDETIAEQGLEVPAGTRVRALLQEACSACSHVYEAIEARDEACGWIDLSEPNWRGIELRGDTPLVHFWYADDGDIDELAVAQASFDGQVLHYDYAIAAWGRLDIRVTGTMAFATHDVRR